MGPHGSWQEFEAWTQDPGLWWKDGVTIGVARRMLPEFHHPVILPMGDSSGLRQEMVVK